MTAKADSKTIVDLGVQPAGERTVFVNNYVTKARIGVYDSEKERRQAVRISLRVDIVDTPVGHSDRFQDVLCYKTLVDGIEDILDGGHINLVETLAEKIMVLLSEDSRSLAGWVRVEKLEAIDAADSVGVELQRKWYR